MKSSIGGSLLILCAIGVGPVGAQAIGGVEQTPANGAVTPQAPADGAGRIAAALDELDAWLGPKGERWQQYLDIPTLRSELAKGSQADPAVVTRSLQRFRGEAKGLELAPFQKVRTAIGEWRAELKRGYGDDLTKLARASRGDHAPISMAEFAKVRTALREKATALASALGSNTALSKTWKSYLKWDLLERHLADDFEVDRASLAELDDVLRRFRANQPGLELPVFQATAKAIARYRALASWASAAKLRDSRPDYERLINGIAAELERHVERPTTETAWKIGRVLGVIDGLGQSPDLAQAIRRRYAQANISAGVSNHFVQRMPDRPLDSMRDVRDCILGVRQIGTARVTGNVRYELMPSDDSVMLAVHIDTLARSQTRGYKGPAVVRASGTTTISGMKYLTLNDASFTSTAGVAHADTRSTIHSINKKGGGFGSRLVTKIGWKRAGETKRASERIAADHAEERLLKEFDSIVARDLGDVRKRYEDKIRAPLIRRGVSPEHLRMSSAPTGVAIEATFATRQQLGANAPPPEMMLGHDLHVQVHESAVNNYLPLALASARIAQETADVPPGLTGDVPNWVKALSLGRPNLAAAASAGMEMVDEAKERIESAVDDDADGVKAASKGEEPLAPAFKPYSITLNDEAPATVQFDDGLITIRVRAAQLVSEDAEYEDWDFIVRYRITPDGDRILLKREGDIEVFPTGFDPAWDQRLTAQQSGFRSTLAKNMNARAKAGQSFPEEIPIEPVRLSRFGVLVLRELVADDGWLTVGWSLPEAGKVGTKTPAVDAAAAAVKSLP